MYKRQDLGWDSVRLTYDAIEGIRDNLGKRKIYVSDVSKDHELMVQDFIKSGERLGFKQNQDLNGDISEGIGHYPISTRNGMRWTASDGFLKPAMGLSNLTVFKNSQVTKLITTNGRVTAVEFFDRKSELKKVKIRIGAVLTAGAINTPQLLMLSGIGPATHLKSKGITPISNIKNIGKNMQDHLGIDYLFESDTPSLNRKLGSWRGRISSLIRYASFRDGPFS